MKNHNPHFDLDQVERGVRSMCLQARKTPMLIGSDEDIYASQNTQEMEELLVAYVRWQCSRINAGVPMVDMVKCVSFELAQLGKNFWIQATGGPTPEAGFIACAEDMVNYFVQMTDDLLKMSVQGDPNSHKIDIPAVQSGHA